LKQHLIPLQQMGNAIGARLGHGEPGQYLD
jgi:hypothetical protein